MNLREWLFRQRLSITYFAGLIKVDRSYIYQWMQGKNIPSNQIMDRIRKISRNEVSTHEDLKDEREKKYIESV